jgi:hypothetical protein
MGPGEELAGFPLADEFFPMQGGDETVAEEFGEGFDAFEGQEMEAALGIDKTTGGKDVEVGVKVQVVAEGLHGGDGGKAALGQIEPGTHPVAQALEADAEKVVEEFAPFAEDAAQGFGHGFPG